MGKTYENLNPELQAWLGRQKLFFVATAPLAASGHVNCSPKGGDTFRIINDREVAYLDLTGSGIETIAHLQENRRIVLMFCAFDGPPKIVRLHGQGDVVYPSDPAYAALAAHFPTYVGARAIIRVAVTRIGDSCGYSVPLMTFTEPRTILDQWADQKTPAGLHDYRREKNRLSLDGCPGYRDAGS